MAVRRRVLYDPKNDFYALFGVKPTCTSEDLRAAYRTKAKDVHPDLNQHRIEWAKLQFQRVNDAYEVLSATDTRSQYDVLRAEYFGVHTTRTAPSNSTGYRANAAGGQSAAGQSGGSTWQGNEYAANASRAGRTGTESEIDPDDVWAAWREANHQRYHTYQDTPPPHTWRPGIMGLITGPYRLVISVLAAALIFGIVTMSFTAFFGPTMARLLGASLVENDQAPSDLQFIWQQQFTRDARELSQYNSRKYQIARCDNAGFRIASPVDNQVITSQPFDIRGTVRSESVQVYYTFEIEPYIRGTPIDETIEPAKWQLSPGLRGSVTGDRPLFDSVLIPKLEPGTYILRLRPLMSASTLSACEVRIRVQ